MQLPTEIQKVLERKELSFIVGDDVESAKQDKVLESTSLLLSLEGYDHWDDDLRIELNGQRLRGRAAGDAIRFEDVVPS